jgi:non-specific serine/threonine protein kinase
VVKALRDRLMRPQTPLLTLTGPPGVGKTRLSLQVATNLLGEFEHGVFFVSLAPINDVDFVPAVIAETLGVREVGGRTRFTQLKDHLRDRQMLLVLDNFEQVIGAAPWLVELLAISPYLSLLITSREALHVRGERQFPVAPLELPDLTEPSRDALSLNPAVQLFVERAQSIDPDFELTDQNAATVAAICVRLDGLPLAIELAAARIKLLALREIHERLSPGGALDAGSSRLKLLAAPARDRPARQQTLREAIAWSYNLLDPAEQALFARLAVFPGSFTLTAALSVCNYRSDLPFDVAQGIASLLDKSLLRPASHRVRTNGDVKHNSHSPEPHDEGRFGMLETIQEYARERLEESGQEEEIRRDHALYYLALAERAEAQLRGSGEAAWLDRLEVEHDNLRSALAWALNDQSVGPDGETTAVEIGLRLAAALGWFWFVRGHFSEGRKWLEAAMAKAEDRPSHATDRSAHTVRSMARALSASGKLALRQSDYEAAERDFAQSLTLWRELEDLGGVAGSLINLAQAALEQGDPALARSLAEESLAHRRGLGDKRGIAEALQSLGIIAEEVGHHDQAAALLEESLAVWRELGDQGAIANTLQNFAGVAINRDDLGHAALMIEESMALSVRQGFTWLVADAQGLGATLALRLGDYERSRALLAQCLTYYHETADLGSIASCLALSAELTYEQLRPSLERAAPSANAQPALARAARLLAAANTLRAATGTVILRTDPDNTERTLAAVKAALDHENFSRAWSEGERMSVEQAIALALSMDKR